MHILIRHHPFPFCLDLHSAPARASALRPFRPCTRHLSAKIPSLSFSRPPRRESSACFIAICRPYEEKRMVLLSTSTQRAYFHVRALALLECVFLSSWMGLLMGPTWARSRAPAIVNEAALTMCTIDIALGGCLEVGLSGGSLMT
jgi:hypothetical protein